MRAKRREEMRGKAEVHTIDVFTEIVGVLYEVPTDPPEGDLATDVVGKSEDFDETLGNEEVSVLVVALAPAMTGESSVSSTVIAVGGLALLSSTRRLWFYR